MNRSFLFLSCAIAALALLILAFPSWHLWGFLVAGAVGFFLLFAGLEYLFYRLPSCDRAAAFRAIVILGILAAAAYVFWEKLPEDFGHWARVASLGALAAVGAFSLRRKYRGGARQRYPGADPFIHN